MPVGGPEIPSDLQRCCQQAASPGEWRAGPPGCPAHAVPPGMVAARPGHPPGRRVAAWNELAPQGPDDLGRGLRRRRRARPAVRGERTADAREGRPVRRSRTDVVGDGAADRRAAFVGHPTARSGRSRRPRDARARSSQHAVRWSRRRSCTSWVTSTQCRCAPGPSRPVRRYADNVHYVITTIWPHPSRPQTPRQERLISRRLAGVTSPQEGAGLAGAASREAGACSLHRKGVDLERPPRPGVENELRAVRGHASRRSCRNLRFAQNSCERLWRLGRRPCGTLHTHGDAPGNRARCYGADTRPHGGRRRRRGTVVGVSLVVGPASRPIPLQARRPEVRRHRGAMIREPSWRRRAPEGAWGDLFRDDAALQYAPSIGTYTTNHCV